ncbi:MAG: AAA family ATPase [Butyribacter sp.]|nr:AAA family ATPase [Butyribacter sp.]
MEKGFEMQFREYLDSGFPILYIKSYEENKVDEIITRISGNRELVEWNEARGFVDFVHKKPLFKRGSSLEETLDYLDMNGEIDRKIFVIKDAAAYMDNPVVVAKLKQIALDIVRELDGTIVIVSPSLRIPKEIEKFVTIFSLDELDSEDIKGVVSQFLEEQGLPGITDTLMEEMSNAFKGLSQYEINNILALAVANHSEFSKRDLQYIFEQKRQMIMKSGILEMIPVKESINDIGGLENLKEWLEKKAKVLRNIGKAQEFGVDIPKGVLIAGMPGCGKSLTAKAAANQFDIPLLRLDMGKLMGKYVGESEENMRRAIALAEAVSPCVLWIDEMEKAFAGIGDGQNSSEVTTRLFGTFLTWMQDKKTMAFVIATANNISKLPPELLRKGRFDEIFYVALPNESERRKIFQLHIAKRRKEDLSSIDISELVEETEGYSGADIEGVVKESIENAFIDGSEHLTTKHILEAIESTSSLSEIMGDELDDMEETYEDRNFKKASR